MAARADGEQSSCFFRHILTVGNWRETRSLVYPLVVRGSACERRGAVAATMAPALAGRAVAMVVPTSARLTGLEERARAGLGEARDSESLSESCGSPLPISLSAD